MNMLTGMVIPPWVRWAALAVAAGFIFLFGQLRGERIAGERHVEYVNAQAKKTVKIAQAQTKVVVQTEVKYRDRIQKIYVKGDVIEKEVPVYVTQSDNAGCTINAGFVRVYDAAWSGEPPGTAADSDREPSGIPLSEVAETDAWNAKVCLAWREQALGWHDFYREIKNAINNPDGKSP